MNIVFLCLFIACAVCLLFCNPEGFLAALLDGTSKSATLCVALLASYTVWLGLMQVWEDSGVTKKVSRIVKPLSRRLFRTDDNEALTAISMNLSANMLGIGGAATPYGIRAANLLDKTKNADYASCMLFVVNATSVQLIPTAVIGIRVALGSANPADIVLPTFLASGFSTLLAAVLTALTFRIKTHTHTRIKQPKTQKRIGAGIR